jgi:hypothetical protein
MKAYELYKSKMDSKIESQRRSLEDSLLNSYHSDAKSEAIAAYDKKNQYTRNNASFVIAAEARESLERVSHRQRKCNHVPVISLTEHSEYLGAYIRGQIVDRYDDCAHTIKCLHCLIRYGA